MISDFFRELRRFFVLYLIRPVVLLCGALISSVYNVVFAWWLDRWTSKGLWARLERDIKKDYPWLFERYGARALPFKPYRQVLDYANVTVAVDDLLFQFTRGHGDFHVSVAPGHAPHDWYDFGEAIDLAYNKEPIRASARNYKMSDFQQLFEAHIERLRVFFSEAVYGEPRRDKSMKKLIPL
ncbi:MAG TPA: hypothetical protein VNU20_06160 [Candidatus Sulfotelmatobacter sp.]|jgi:hypothetical protein|nr:hypothetical protein [Candidatus Sulfotelmatobacter sp.]